MSRVQLSHDAILRYTCAFAPFGNIDVVSCSPMPSCHAHGILTTTEDHCVHMATAMRIALQRKGTMRVSFHTLARITILVSIRGAPVALVHALQRTDL